MPKTDFDLVVDEELANEVEAVKDENGIPYCVKHHCRMKQTSGGGKRGKAYYGCPVDGCNETGQVVKTKRESVVPSQPVQCPNCKDASFCERDPVASRGAYSILRCPACGWKTNPLPHPGLAAAEMEFRSRPPRRVHENIGER